MWERGQVEDKSGRPKKTAYNRWTASESCYKHTWQRSQAIHDHKLSYA